MEVTLLSSSIRTKLTGILAFQFIALAVIGWQGAAGMKDLNETVKITYFNEFVPARLIADANSALLGWNRAILNHILAENTEKMDEYERIVDREKDTVCQILDSLVTMRNLSSEEKELIRRIQEQLQRAIPFEKNLLMLSREGRTKDAEGLLHLELRPRVDEIDVLMSEFQQLQEKRLLQARMTIDERTHSYGRRIFLTIGSVLLVSLVVTISTSKSMVGSIHQLVKGAREFGRGNLDYRVEVKSRDEIQELASALNSMAEKRKIAEDSLRSSTEKLKLFAYSVVHDLKSPVIGIHGLTGLLQRRYRDILDHQGEKLCDQIMKTSEQVVSLVELVNTYIATKEMPLNIEEINSREIFQMARDEFSTQLSIRRIGCFWPERGPLVRADRFALLRVFRNLLDNALKYGGEQLSEIHIRYEESADFHVFSVCDNGVGVKTEHPEKLFALFQRHETSKGVDGTGLGLAIVKEIIEKHQGEVWAEPRSQGGVSFFITISKKL
jgi:signal transduction histidine kinase